jgi:predicted transposase YbfD/YdcC
MSAKKRKRRQEAEKPVPEGLKSLCSILSFLQDPRDRRGMKHDFMDILVLAIIGKLWGCRDFVSLVQFLKIRRKWLKTFLKLDNGIPSHDTFSRVFSRIDPNDFRDCFIRWISVLMEDVTGHIAIDGKACRAASPRGAEHGNTTYIMNATHTGTGLSLFQVKVGEKTNEKTVMPMVLAYLWLEGSVVTSDAMGTMKETLNTIRAKGGDFVLPVKANTKALLEDCEFEIVSCIADGDCTTEVQFGKEHGRFERRECFVTSKAPTLSDPSWKGIAQIAKVVRQTTEISTGKVSNQTVYYISSKIFTASDFADCVKNHWQILCEINFNL